MTSFTAYANIPHSTNNPSDDQPLMEINQNSNIAIWNVDHVGYNSSGTGGVGSSGGQHKFVTFNQKSAPSAPTDPISVLYTANGTQSIVASPYFRNANGTFPMLPVRAWGVFTTTSVNGAIALTMGSNVSTITRLASTYTIVLTTGAVTGTTVGVLWTMDNAGSLTWSYSVPNTLTLSSVSGAGHIVTFSVLQV